MPVNSGISRETDKSNIQPAFVEEFEERG